ncbi:hypothetical protein GC167_10220 [bacterium]|nr:hypothetical protein [bacterium]
MNASNPPLLPTPDPELNALRQRWEQAYRLPPPALSDQDWTTSAERLSAEWLRIPAQHPRGVDKKPSVLRALWPVWTAAAVLLMGWGAFRGWNPTQTPAESLKSNLDWAVLENIDTDALLLELDPAVLFHVADEAGLTDEGFEDWDLDPQEIESLQWNDAGLLLYEM